MTDDSCRVYASNLDHNAVFAYRLDRGTGALVPVGEPVEVPVPWAMGMSPDQRFIYVIGHGDHKIVAIALDAPDGGLRRVGALELPDKLGLMDPSYLHIDPSGRYLLTCDYWSDKIGSFEIGADGALLPESAAVVSVGSGIRGSRGDRQHPHSIQLDPSGRYVIVPFTGKDRIEFYRFHDGKIVSPSIAYFETVGGTGPRHCAFHPTRPWMYFNNERGALRSRVTQYELVPDRPAVVEKGTWSTLPADYTDSNAIADVHLSPCGRFLYVSNRGHDSLAAFAISETHGGLEPLGQFATSVAPTAFAIDPTGRFLIAATTGSDTIAIHRREVATGALSAPEPFECRWYGRSQKQLPASGGVSTTRAMTPGEKYARGKGRGTPWVLIA